jgi:hypothetical protein
LYLHLIISQFLLNFFDDLILTLVLAIILEILILFSYLLHLSLKLSVLEFKKDYFLVGLFDDFRFCFNFQLRLFLNPTYYESTFPLSLRESGWLTKEKKSSIPVDYVMIWDLNLESKSTAVILFFFWSLPSQKCRITASFGLTSFFEEKVLIVITSTFNVFHMLRFLIVLNYTLLLNVRNVRVWRN